jgi:quinoprotein glucose dehydrogenase
VGRRILLVLVVVLAVPSAARGQERFVVEREVAGFGFAVNVAFAPDGTMFVADKDVGQIRVVRDGVLLPQPFVELPVQVTTNETGLLGVAVHPDFPAEPWVYAYFTDATDGFNRLVRIRAEGDRGTDVETLLDLLPAVGFHNGGDIAFGPDGLLYVVVGDGTVPDHAQDPESLGGKVLRVTPDGSVPADNPFGSGDPVFALGIRNSFGLCFDPATGDLWETENGPESHDEVNRIVAGGNYGWPLQLGPGGEPGFIDPVHDFPDIVVPTGCAFDAGGGILYFGGGYSGNLFRMDVATETVSVVLNIEGGIIDVARAPDGSIRLVTPTAIFRSEAPSGDASPSPTSATQGSPSPTPTDVSPSPGASASPSAGGAGTLTGVGLVILALLVGGLLLMRSRLLRR